MVISIEINKPSTHDDLVVDIGDIHHILNIVSKVIGQDSSNDVKCDVATSMSHVSAVVDSWTAGVPLDCATSETESRK